MKFPKAEYLKQLTDPPKIYFKQVKLPGKSMEEMARQVTNKVLRRG